MDPRHPELAISRIDELMKQFKDVLHRLQTETISSKLAMSEREGSLVVQEICLVAPRLHESMMQVSRTRRSAIAHGLVDEEREDTSEEIYVAPNQAETVIVEPKPRKKKTAKKAKK